MARVVVVTGGSSGIGRAVAERFARSGDHVVVVARDGDALEVAARQIGALAARCDATSPSEVEALAGEIGAPVHVLCNMAGANTDFEHPLEEGSSLEDVAKAWLSNLESNLMSTVLVTTALLPALAPGGSIINVSSIGAEYASSAYGAAKAAVAAWTAGLSARVGPRDITANVIAPGYIEQTNYFRGRLSDDRLGELIAMTHDKRAGRPDDIAETAYFLSSRGARHITGQTLHVNGGAYTTR